MAKTEMCSLFWPRIWKKKKITSPLYLWDHVNDTPSMWKDANKAFSFSTVPVKVENLFALIKEFKRATPIEAWKIYLSVSGLELPSTC